MLHAVVLLGGTAEAADRERRRNLHHQTWTRNAGVAQAHFPKLSAPTHSTPYLLSRMLSSRSAVAKSTNLTASTPTFPGQLAIQEPH